MLNAHCTHMLSLAFIFLLLNSKPQLLESELCGFYIVTFMLVSNLHKYRCTFSINMNNNDKKTAQTNRQNCSTLINVRSEQMEEMAFLVFWIKLFDRIKKCRLMPWNLIALIACSLQLEM